MENQDKLMEYLRENDDPYSIKVENVNVQFVYSENNKRFNECMINILKERLRYK